jgi:hypothetical protein
MSIFKQYQAAFTAHLRDPQHQKKPYGVDARRMGVYREIVFNNFLVSVSACFPVLQAILGKRRFAKLARQCFSSHHFASPLFRDISKSFVDFLQTLDLSGNELPAFTAQLAHYEWVELYVSHVPTVALPSLTTVQDANDLADCILQLQPAHMLASYDYPVHLLSKKHAGTPSSTYLLVFRTPDFKIEFIQLNALTYQLLQQLQSSAATVCSHLRQFADTSLVQLPKQSVYEFGLQTLHALYLQQALVVASHEMTYHALYANNPAPKPS